jgi:hypothetical protein
MPDLNHPAKRALDAVVFDGALPSEALRCLSSHIERRIAGPMAAFLKI